MKTVTIIRTFKHSQEAIALFPQETTGLGMCQSYQHIGQHAPASYEGILRITRPATPAEAAPLICELEAIGYDLDIRTRRPARRQA